MVAKADQRSILKKPILNVTGLMPEAVSTWYSSNSLESLSEKVKGRKRDVVSRCSRYGIMNFKQI